MKKISIFITLLLLLCTTRACTHNNGDIGFLFGQWRLHEITDGNDIEPCDTVFLAFQSDIVQLRKVVYASYDFNLLTGLYQHQDSLLQFSFLNLNGTDVLEDSLREQMLLELASLHIKETDPIFQVSQLTRNKMTLKYDRYNYYLEKLQ